MASNTGVTELVIFGDFNFPCVDWSILAIIADNLTEYFCEILVGHNLTHALKTREALIHDTSVYPHTFDSGDFLVCFSIKSKFKRPNNYTKRKLYCYSRADFDCLRSSLLQVPWDSSDPVYDL